MTGKRRYRKTATTALNRKLLALAISQAMLAGAGQAAEIKVDTLSDQSNGGCTLRDAIGSANNDLAVAGCTAGSGADVIVFDSSLMGGQIDLTNGQLVVESDLTIQGPGADQLAISAGNSSRIFRVDDGDPDLHRTVAVSGLSLTAGNSGGSGGALHNFEDLTLDASTLSANTAVNGGAIDNRGSMTLSSSTLSGNSASERGGAIAHYGVTVTVINSTLSANTANLGGGGIISDGPLTVQNSSLVGSAGAGLLAFLPAITHLTNTLITDSVGAGDCLAGGDLGTNLNNLIPTGDCDAALTADALLGPLQDNGGSTLTHALQAASQALNAGDAGACPQLDQRGMPRDDGLCDIGAFELAGTPPLVVNTVSDELLDDGLCSLREAVQSANNDAVVFATAGECGPGLGPDAITFDPALNGVTIALSGSPLLVQSAMVISGPGADLLTLSGDNASQVFVVNDDDGNTSHSVTIEGLTLTEGAALDPLFPNNVGGALVNFENLNLKDCTLSANTAANGGGLDNRGALALSNSTLTANSATNRGGAITHYGATLTVVNSTLSGNTADGGFGALTSDGSLTLLNATLVGNSGGGLNIFTGGISAITNTLITDSTDGADCTADGGLAINLNNLIQTGTCDAALTVDALPGPLQDNGGPVFTHALLPGSAALDAGDRAACPSDDQRGRLRNDGLCDIGAFEVDANTSPAIMVNTSDDIQADDGKCSLREAVVSANLDEAAFATSGECAAGFGPDAITFDPQLNGVTIALSGTGLALYSSAEIRGPGADQLTISGSNASQILRVDDGEQGIDRAVTISGLTFSDANSGAAGGALVNFENLTIDASTLSGNTAGVGGAFDNRGSLTLSGSTLSGNSASDRGGAISHYGITVTVTNSTLSGNTAGSFGGAIVADAPLTIVNGTLANNVGGGLTAEPGQALLINTIITGSTGGDDCNANPGVNLNNLIPSGICNASITDEALLGPLQDNGGPTLTHALLAGSAAKDAGSNPNCPDDDQRGLTRSDGLCDIGAFEAATGNAADIVVTTALDVVVDDNLCSLREAVQSANNDAAPFASSGECPDGFGADTITFDASLNGVTVGLSGTGLTLASEVTIQGPGADQLTISGGSQSRIFDVSNNNAVADLAVTVSGLTLTEAGDSAILNSEVLTIREVSVSANTAQSGNGGGLYNFATATLLESTISGNSALLGGAVVNAASASLSITNSTLSGNSALASSGGIFNQGSLTMINSTVANNSLRGLYNSGYALLINSLLAGTAPGVDCSGGVDVASTNNLIETGDCNADLTSGAMLAPLANNGGTTLTHALMPGSSAIDAGSQSECTNRDITVDQTGVMRPVDGDDNMVPVCDIGAFEYVPPVPAPEIDVTGMGVAIVDGDTTPDPADDTDFGDVAVNTTRVRTFTISNNGDAALSIVGLVTVSGAGFTISMQPGVSVLGSGQSAAFEVSFNPAAVGAAAGTVTIGSDDSDENPYTFAVAGNGTAPEIEVSGNAVSIADGDTTPDPADDTDFGDVAVNTTRVRTFTISNNGDAALSIVGLVTVSGAGFTISMQPGVSVLGSGQSAAFEVSFNPAAVGAAAGTVTIGSDDSDENPYTFAVAGNGTAPEIEVSGNAVSIADGDTTPDLADDTDFGDVAVNTTRVRTFTITNTGSATLNLTAAVNVSGDGFGVTQPDSSILGPGQGTTIEVSFSPTAAGPALGTITIVSDDSDESTFTFDVAGNGLSGEDLVFRSGFETLMP